MSNSPLVNYTRYSPNYSPRNAQIDTITIHHCAGNITVEALGEMFAKPQAVVSSNYGIDSAGNIALFVEEHNRSWCSSNPLNDHRAVTIEVANIGEGENEFVADMALTALVNLLVDICVRNNIPQLLWENNAALIGHTKRQNITVHRWFANTECPGTFFMENMQKICKKVNTILNGITNSAWTVETAKAYVKEKCGLEEQTMEYITEYYKWGHLLIIKIADAIKKGE